MKMSVLCVEAAGASSLPGNPHLILTLRMRGTVPPPLLRLHDVVLNRAAGTSLSCRMVI
jgi:hypothetical protein